MSGLRGLMAAAVAGAAVMLSGGSASAAFLVGGNTRPDNADVDGSVSFAVFQLDAVPVAGDAYGTGLPGFDLTFAPNIADGSAATLTGQYLYLYQFANDGNGLEDIHRITVSLVNQSALVIAWGDFAGTGFIDADGAVGAGNPFGNNGAFFDSPPLIRAPADTSGVLASPFVTLIGDGVDPTIVDKNANLAAVFAAVTPGSRTILFGFTSNVPYGFANAGVIDGSATNGTVTTLVPAPSAALLLLTMLPGMGLVARARRKSEE